MTEFRTIPGYEDYEISCDGIKVRRRVPHPSTGYKDAFLSIRRNRTGYLTYSLRPSIGGAPEKCSCSSRSRVGVDWAAAEGEALRRSFRRDTNKQPRQ